MLLTVFAAAFGLVTMVAAQNIGVFLMDDLDTGSDGGIFARANRRSRRARPHGGTRAGQGAVPSSSAWSQTSDSSAGSVSAGSDGGGISQTTVEMAVGRAKVTRKRPGEPPETTRLSAGKRRTFLDNGKSRIKVQGVNSIAHAEMRISGARSQMKVDARNGESGLIGATRGPGDPYVNIVDQGAKSKLGPEDYSDHIKQFGEIRGKGTIRAKIASKQEDKLQPSTPILFGDPIPGVGTDAQSGPRGGGGGGGGGGGWGRLTADFRDQDGNRL